MRKITTNQISKLHKVFKFLDLGYYLSSKRVKECYIVKQNQPKSLLDIYYKQKIEIEIIEDDLIQIQTFDDNFIEELLRASKDEILSNIYNIGENDRLHYLDHYKMDFYSICKSIQLSDFLLNIRIDNQNYIELAEKRKNIIDRYIETVSSLAYKWSYELHFIEKQHRGYIPQKEVTMPKKGVQLRENIIFDILFAYDYDSIENDNCEKDDSFIDFEVIFKDKNWISFSEGALNRFLYRKVEKGDRLNWIYKKRDSDKQPYILGLVVFCIALFPKKVLVDFKKNKDIVNYISEYVLLDGKKFTMDISNISKAQTEISKNGITLENLGCHFNQC